MAREYWTGLSRVAFAAASPKADSYSGSRGKFFGKPANRAKPAAMLAVSSPMPTNTGA